MVSSSATNVLLSPPRPARRERAVWIVGLWTAVAVLFVAHEVLSNAADARDVPIWYVVYWSVSEWYTWAALTPAVLLLVSHCPITREGWWWRIGAHAAGAVAFGLAQILIAYLLDQMVVSLAASGRPSIGTWLAGFPVSTATGAAPATLGYLLTRKIGFNIVVYAAIALAGHLVSYYTMYRDRELRTARLESELSRARLDMLRSQLEPHFLFNSLNAIAELIHRDPDAAEHMTQDLADLLRRALATGGPDEVPLRDELHLLEAYCNIERVRFGERLRLEFDIEPGIDGARVPALLLQPLVENAIRHAVQPRPAGGRVTVRASQKDGRLRMEVRDDGSGWSPTARDGIGLSNTRSRLFALYGEHHQLVIGSNSTGGSCIAVEVPLRLVAAGAPA